MSGRRTKILVLTAVTVVLSGTACGQTVKRTSLPATFSPLPSATISTTLPPAVQQAFCQHLSQLQQTVSQIQATPDQASADVHTALSNLGTELHSDQQQLQTSGQPQLAAVVQSVVTAVTTLDGSIPQNGTLPSGIATGLAIVSGALQQIPASVCPPPAA